jgi:hypothetical protein
MLKYEDKKANNTMLPKSHSKLKLFAFKVRTIAVFMAS